MKHIYLTLLGLLAVLPVAAQISIDDVNAGRNAEFKEKIKTTSADADYFNEARYRAERAAIRKERNTLEFGASLQGTLTSYNDAWIESAGGDNSIAVIAALRLHHIFTKGTFTIETKAEGKFGYNRMRVENADGTEEGIWFKNQDEFQISTAPAYKFSKNWSFGSILKFRSQFANGYVSRTEQKAEHRKSRFMTPGYLDVSVGFNYVCPKKSFPVKINLSPLALSATFVESAAIRGNSVDAAGNIVKSKLLYGIEDPNATSKWEGGSSIQIDFDRTWGKNGWFRYRTSLYSFYGWITDMNSRNKFWSYQAYHDNFDLWNERPEPMGQKIGQKPTLAIHPIVRWENTFEIKATKYISTQISFQLYYNRAQSYDVQTQTLLSVGFAYTFKNK